MNNVQDSKENGVKGPETDSTVRKDEGKSIFTADPRAISLFWEMYDFLSMHFDCNDLDGIEYINDSISLYVRTHKEEPAESRNHFVCTMLETASMVSKLFIQCELLKKYRPARS